MAVNEVKNAENPTDPVHQNDSDKRCSEKRRSVENVPVE